MDSSSARVFLMNPPTGLYRRDDRCQSKVDEQTVRVVFAPVDLALLASVVRASGGEAFIGDYSVRAADVKQDLAEFAPTVLVLNTTVHTVRDDMAILAAARQLCPGIRTFVRGEGVAVQGERVLQEYPQCDGVFGGEPEDTVAQLVAQPELALWQVEGLITRNADGVAMRTGRRALVEPLDRLPLPARDLLDNAAYRSPENGRPMTVISAQRGCPSRCVFCPAGSMFGYRVRERGVADVMSEIRECVDVYGIRDFLFHGDTFTLRKGWVLALCEAICAAGLQIRWGCNSRVDTMDGERAAALKRAGCWVVAFGFEHGDDEMLRLMKKGQTAKRAFEAVRMCREAGLLVHGFFLAGLPWETHETLARLGQYARRLNPDFFDFNIACPLPGTELFEICEREGLFSNNADADAGSYAQAGVRTFALSGEDLTQWRRRTLLRLYLRPGYVLRILRHAVRTGTVWYYVRAALGRLRGLLTIRTQQGGCETQQ